MIYLKFQIRLFFEYYSMEDNSVQSRLSQTALYLLSTAQVKANMIDQQVLSILNSKYTYNELKKIIKTGIHTLDNIQHIFNQIGTKRMYHVIKRITNSLNTICNQLIENLEKQKSKLPMPLMYNEQVSTPAKNVNGQSKKIIDFQSMYKQKLNKLGGVCIYNQNYKRKIDQKSIIDYNKNGQKKQKTKEDQQQDQKTFKKKLFQKMKGELKELEEDLYSPYPDQVSTFIIFQKKFLQSFNHFSHAQNIQQLANYLQSSQLSAIQLLSKSKDMSEEISKYRVEIENLMRETVMKTKERNENISQKFDEILQKFIKKRIQIYKKTMQKVNVYNKMIKQRQVSRVSIGVETNVKQLSTIKNIERRMFEIQTKYKLKEEQRVKNSKNLIDKLNNQKNYLTSEVTKLKIIEKISQEELQKIRKQNKELLQSLRKEKSKNQKINLLYDQIKDVNPDESHQIKKKNSGGRLSILSKITTPLDEKIAEKSKIIQIDEKGSMQDEKQGETEKKIKEEKQQQKNELKFKTNQKEKGQTISISELQQQINKKSSIGIDILEINEPEQYQIASKRMIRKPFFQQNSLRFLTKKKVIYQQNTLSKSSQLISQIKNYWDQNKQNYIQKTLKTENNLKEQKQSQILIKEISPVPFPSQKNINSKKLKKVVNQNKKQKDVPKNNESKTYKKQQGLSINHDSALDDQQSYQIKLTLVNQEDNQIDKESKPIKTLQKKQKQKQKKTRYQFPILNKKPHKKLKTQFQSESYSQKVSFQFTHLYSLTLNNGDIINFNSTIDIYKKESPQYKKNFKKKQYSGQFVSERRIQKNNYISFKDKQNTNPLTYNRQILKELKFYEQMCRKKQITCRGMQDQEKKQLKMERKQLRSLHINKERSYSNSSDINFLNQNNNISSFILNVKSLMKEDKSFVKNQNLQKIDFETKKKLIKQLLIQGIKTRHRKQTASFCLNNQNIRQTSKYSSIKIKEGEKLKKMRKRQRDRKRQANSFHKKREQIEIGLPQINIKHIF